jgi:hypothetical protein
MAALVSANCGSCGKRHDFFLQESDFFVDRAVYEYICPETMREARVSPEMWNKVVQSQPARSVVVKRVPWQG